MAMGNRLFIGNLSFGVTDAQLGEFFAERNIAVENIRLMRDQATGKSRGFAFAELASGGDVDAAIKELNGKVLDGRPLTVNEARPQTQRGNSRPGGDSGRRSSMGNRQGSDRGQDQSRRRKDDLY
jgi:cold-inducible RNA-binding protein